MKAWDVVWILIAGLAIRALLEIAVVGDSYFLSLANQAFMYLLVVLVLLGTVGRIELFSGFLPAALDPGDPVRLVAAPFVLLAFSLGSIALAALLAAQWDAEFAWRKFGFYSGNKNVHPFLSMHVFAWLLVNAAIAPVVEELIFRRVLLGAFLRKHGPVAAVLLTSLVFSLLHFYSTDYLGTFLFSVVLCVISLRFRSILLCAAVHAMYNVAAFVHQYYFDTFWKRDLVTLAEVMPWMPHLVLLPVSALGVVWLLGRWFPADETTRGFS